MSIEERLTVVCWKWKPHDTYHSVFTADHVNRLASMVGRNLHRPYEFVCVTDDAEGIASHIKTLPLDPVLSQQTHARRPNCYRRLKAFSEDAGEWLGCDRLMSIDLDCVITGDITPLTRRTEDFVIFGDTAKGTPYNGSLWLLKAGSRPQVWNAFDPEASPLQTKAMNIIGSDQAWIAACLGPNEAKFGTQDGIYSYARDVKANGGTLPADARIVFFIGPYDPARCLFPWAEKHYR